LSAKPCRLAALTECTDGCRDCRGARSAIYGSAGRTRKISMFGCFEACPRIAGGRRSAESCDCSRPAPARAHGGRRLPALAGTARACWERRVRCRRHRVLVGDLDRGGRSQRRMTRRIWSQGHIRIMILLELWFSLRRFGFRSLRASALASPGELRKRTLLSFARRVSGTCESV